MCEKLPRLLPRRTSLQPAPKARKPLVDPAQLPDAVPDAPRGAQMGDQRADEPLGADKPSPPRVAQGVPALPAGVPHGAAECLSTGFAAGFAAGADDVTVTCTTPGGTVTAHAKRTPPHSPAQQQASATARAAGTVRPAAAAAPAAAAIATAAPRMCIPLSPAP